MRKYELFIDNEWRSSTGQDHFVRENPANGSVVSSFARATLEDVECVAQSARTAFDAGPWPHASPRERSDVLTRIAALLQEHNEHLARTESEESGVPLHQARQVVQWGADLFQYYAGVCRNVRGETWALGDSADNAFGWSIREPVGVVVAITPWNYPLSQLVWKVAPALAAGCCVIAKPPSLTPGTALELGALMANAGLPEGVYNAVTGSGETIGDRLVSHPLVDKVSFTGETVTGQRIMASASRTTKRLTLELGGKSPNIVFADADLDAAADGVANGIFIRSGQVCTAGSRLLVERSIYDRFVDMVVDRARAFRIGDPNDEVDVGPVISDAHLSKILNAVETGRREGARLVAGGNRIADGDLANGYFMQSTVFADVDNAMTIAQEEIFGPVLCAIPFDGVGQAVELANATRYGLAAGVWTRDLDRAYRVIRDVRAGTCWVNTFGAPHIEMPFGGFKESGFGRELSPHAMDAYTELKAVHMAVHS